jgi:SAM-dependent methyltransferase
MEGRDGAGALALACPRCRRPLEAGQESLRCAACGTSHPVVLGIPDLRTGPDPYICIPDDHEKGRRLAEGAEHVDWCGLVERYWAMTPGTPEDMARRFAAHALSGVERGHHLLSGLDEVLAPPEPGRRRCVLEVGCRAGGVLVAAAQRFDEVVGVDIAFRWLVVARKALEQAGVEARLLAACGEALPLPDLTFDLVIAENVLEHARDPAAIVAEASRVLRPGGVLVLTTWNRFALAPEPHVRLWAVGFLPRRLARRYVRWRRGDPYEHVRLLSPLELRRLLRAGRWARVHLAAGCPSEAETSRLGPAGRTLAHVHRAVKDWPLVRSALLLIGPWLLATAVREDARARS